MIKKTILYMFFSILFTLSVNSCKQKTESKTTEETEIKETTLTGCEMIEQDKATMTMVKNKNLRNIAWCEIILWCGDGGTFNTMGLNDPKDSAPEHLFKKLDKEKLAEKYDVKAVSLNPDSGRKFWTLDEFHIDGSTTIRNFEGIDARYVGDVGAKPDGSPQDLSIDGIPKIMYQVAMFMRTSTLVYNAGKPVFLIEDTDGNVWINKNYQTGVDPTLTIEGMATLDKRLKHFPESWKFRTVILEKDLVLNANGAQRIMWDELGGAYDALEEGTYNYMP
jgi:hypothetical protein